MSSNKDIIAAAFADMAKGDSTRYLAAMVDDIRYELVGDNSWGRLYEGREAILRELGGPLMSRIQQPLVMKTTCLLEDDDYVVLEAVGDNRTSDGRPYRNRYCMIIKMAGGQIVELTEYTDTETVQRVLGERI